jgi:BolA-like protein 3
MLRTSLAPLLSRALAGNSSSTITILRRRPQTPCFSSAAATPSPTEIDASTDAERAIADLIAARLPSGAERVAVRDTSGGCGAMYTIEVRSAAFEGQSTVKQHQLVAKALGDEVKKWHGFSLVTSTPKQ